MLRTLFRTEESRKVLQEHIVNNPHLIDQLLRLVIPPGDDFTDLDGCNILPLADGTVGPLRLLSATNKLHAYYFASKDELKLFNFASGLLVCETIGRKLQKVVSSEKSNLQKLQLCHVGRLLETGDFTADEFTPSDPGRDKWLTEFWTYWNNASEATTSSENIDINHFPGVFRVTRGTASYYAPPKWLHALAAVVEPSHAKHQQLCDKIPELWRFDHEMMPKTLKNDERSFIYSDSFFRFINALQSLASKAGETLGAFVEKRLDIENVKVRLISHFSPCESDSIFRMKLK
jgi:sacsin